MLGRKIAFCAVLALAAIVAAACGGGGGGSKKGFYAGIWNFNGLKVLDDCRTNAPGSVSSQLIVNQDGKRVVVNSGRVTMEGETTDKDGFEVTFVTTTDSGCLLGTACIFENASDGIADAGMAVVLECGRQSCSVVYAGSAVRQGRGAVFEDELMDLETLIEGLGCGGLPEAVEQGRVLQPDEQAVKEAALQAAEKAFKVR